jgi:hypothetical protein
MADKDPDFYAIVSRDAVAAAAQGTDTVALWAQEMMESIEGEEAVFLRVARVYLASADRYKRRAALTFFARSFGAKPEDLKRYLRFKGLVNLMD